MDDRKRQINDLEQQKREQGIFLDTTLIRLGEGLFGRITDLDGDLTFEELAAYRKLQNTIADSEASIQAVEELIRRFKELEENIEVKEEANTACSKELAVMHGRLGKLLLDTPHGLGESSIYTDFCLPYRNQAEALYTKVLSLEERLSGLEEREGGNVFTWIGKGAQGLVLRSFLTKAQDNLEQLRRTVGERYTRHAHEGASHKMITDETSDSAAYRHEGAGNPVIEELCATIEEKRSEAQEIAQYLADLKEEKKTISGGFNAEGGPLKQIQAYKNQITHVRDELKALYRRIGTEAASINGAECREIIALLVKPEDKEILDSAARTSRMMHDDEVTIRKLQASLDIDDEKANIAKIRKAIQEKKEKIAQLEKNIMEFEEEIQYSEANIEKLQELL